LRAHDLDEARAIEAKQRAEELLASNIDKVSEAEALAELVRAAAQLKMIAKLRKTKG
jgi:F-type H+-transporting ATPase subunit epsilon